MKCFSYKDECGIWILRHLKRAIDKWLWLLKTVILLKELKNEPILSLKEYYMHCHVVFSNHRICNCGIWILLSLIMELCM